MHEILTPQQMGQTDAATIAAGTPGIELMENAGSAVADAARRMPVEPGGQGRVLVVCGPGNNGGDGFVAARLLAGEGRDVALMLAGDADRLKGDARTAFERWRDSGGATLAAGEIAAGAYDLVVDALFGAGLDRPVTGEVAGIIAAMNGAGAPVLAVDLPSGIDGATGAVQGVAVEAARTVTFFRKKPGHLLLPGRAHCGPVEVAQIGIAEETLAGFDAVLPVENAPANWLAELPRPGVGAHKYRRGFALAVSGPMTRTGAARLAAHAALRIGAGLVVLASPPEALAVNAAHLTAVMLKRMEGADGLRDILADERFTAVAIGPALGTGPAERALVLAALAAGRATVLDADALTAFEEEPEALYGAINGRTAATVMTPHEGEFDRLFGWTLSASGKLDQALEAARLSGAVVVYKGADTVIAGPDGRATINANAPPWLATAGSGDVLTGMICGLAAQSMPAFEAACAAVWMHGAAARAFGPGLTAEDIDGQLPGVLSGLFREAGMNG